MDQIFHGILQGDFSELTGLRVEALIPVSERLVNELVEAQLRGNQNITYCRISIERQNHLDVELKTPLWPWPLTLKLKLFGSVDLTGSPTLRAFLENKVLLGRLGSFLKALPPGISIYKDQLSVDLGSFVTAEQQKFLKLIKAVNINTDVGRILLEVRAEN